MESASSWPSRLQELANAGSWSEILEASETLQRVATAAAATGDMVLLLELRLFLGRAADAVGDDAARKRALEELRGALVLANGLADADLLFEARTCEALLLLSLGRPEESRVHLEVILALNTAESRLRAPEVSATRLRLAHVITFDLARPAEAVPYHRALLEEARLGPPPILRLRKVLLAYCLAHAGQSQEASVLLGETLEETPAGPWRDEVSALLDCVRNDHAIPLWRLPPM